MDSTTLSQLSTRFNEKLDALKFAISISSCDDESVQSLLETIEVKIAEMRLHQADMKAALKSWKDDVLSTQARQSVLSEHINRLTYVSNFIPNILPKLQKVPVDVVHESSPDDGLQQVISEETADAAKENRAPCPVERRRKEPHIEYITLPEFDHVPKYMRGRLPHAKVNAVIDALNEAFSGKHKLTTAKKSSLSDASRARLATYKKQRNADCQGLTFVTDDDIKTFATIKQDSAFRAVIVILRHCGRLREVHGGGYTRYAVPL